MTGHTEVVLVVFDPAKVSYADLLRIFWESHDPTQGMRQGNDVGTTYRSAIYTFSDEQHVLATSARADYESALKAPAAALSPPRSNRRRNSISRKPNTSQYLAKNPGGYCGLQGTGVTCPAPAQVA